MNTPHTHIALADESNWNNGRYRSICLVTSTLEDARQFYEELKKLLKTHNTTEFKWKKPCRRHGISLVDFFFERHNRMRVDVITWDTEDDRHRSKEFCI